MQILSHFQKTGHSIDLETSGRYKLVPEQSLDAILKANSWLSSLDFKAKGLEGLAFATRFFRSFHDLNRSQLAEQSNVHRNQIKQIEDAKLKKQPQENTLKKLATVLGAGYLQAVVELGYLASPESNKKSGEHLVNKTTKKIQK